jgi:hypothetical protein
MLCRYVPEWENGIRLTPGRASLGPDLVMTRALESGIVDLL